MLKAKEVQISYKRNRTIERDRLICSNDIYQFAIKFYDDEMIDYKEFVYVILMNNHLRPNGWYKVSEGGLNEAMADVRIIMQAALLSNSTAIALVHNHPSGQVKPSMQDDELTKKVKDACDLLSIRMIDHVIVSSNDKFYSYHDCGRL